MVNNKLIIDILYNEKNGEEIRRILEELCSPDIINNDSCLGCLIGLLNDISDDIEDPENTFMEFLIHSIPDFLTHFSTLQGYMFYNSNWLTEIVIPKNIMYIWDHCFSDCDNLKRVSFEKGSYLTDLSYINETAFNDCYSIAVFDLSNTSVTQMVDLGLEGDIETLILPNTVKEIWPGSFTVFKKVIFKDVNSIADLKLDISDLALQNDWGWSESIEIITNTDKDKLTLESYNGDVVLGPKLKKNSNIRIRVF